MIKYPEYYTEFEIQAYVYRKLLGKGYKIRGNVPLGRKGERPTENAMYFDLVLYDKNLNPIEIIETKDSKKHKKTGTKQYKKYSSLGIKLTYLCGIKEAREFVKSKKNIKSRPRFPKSK